MEGGEELFAVEREGDELLEAGIVDDEQGGGLGEGGGAGAQVELERVLAVGDVGEVGVDLVEDEQVDGRVAEGCGVGGVEDGGTGVRCGQGVEVGGVEGGDFLLDAVFVDGEIFGGEAEGRACPGRR